MATAVTQSKFNFKDYQTEDNEKLPSFPLQLKWAKGSDQEAMERSFTPSQLGDAYKMTEDTLNSFVQITDKVIKQNWPQFQAMGNLPYD